MKTRNKTRKSWTQSTSSGSDRGAGAQRLLPAHSGSHGSGASNQGSRALPTLHSRLQFFDEKWLHAVSKIWVGSLLSFGCYISSIMSVAFWYVCSFVSNSLWPHGCNPPGSSAHGIFQARILEWVAISYSRGSSRSTDWTQVSRVSWITRRILYQFSSVQFSRSVVSNSATPWIAARQASLSITNSRVHSDSSIESVMPSSHLILCRPLLILPQIPPRIRVFSNEWTLHMRWPKYWSFSFNISPSNEHPGLISFRKDWLDLLAVQGTLKSLLQHHSSKASILWRPAFFTVQLSHLIVYDLRNKL